MNSELHLKSVALHPEKYPQSVEYPFNLPLFQHTTVLNFDSQVTFFAGENGSGKTTLLEAITKKCGIHIWRDTERTKTRHSPYEEIMHEFIAIELINGRVPGSFFGASIFQHFADVLEQWATADPGSLDYFGGKSLLTQSHGQSLMSFFKNRYKLRGLHFLDEPETGLSPKTQLQLLEILTDTNNHEAQFIIATHSPILLACPGAKIFSFDTAEIVQIEYEQTSHYNIYKDFMKDPKLYLKNRNL